MIHAIFAVVHRVRHGHTPPLCRFAVALCCPTCDHPRGLE